MYFNKDRNNKFHVWICDDGLGMGSDELENAMQLGGTTDDYEQGDLSKYGMGMKTASLSQASKLIVLSKKKKCQLTAFSWDMHHVNTVDKWEMFKLEKSEIRKRMKLLENSSDGFIAAQIKKLFSGHSWTTVIWDDLKDFRQILTPTNQMWLLPIITTESLTNLACI